MMNESTDRTLGRIEGQVEALTGRVDAVAQAQTEISTTVTEIKTMLAERRGERRALGWLAGVAGAGSGALFGWMSKYL